MNKMLTRMALSLVAVASLTWGTAYSKTESDGVAPAKVKKHSKKKDATYYGDDRYLHGSQETSKQRDKRLTRECKGGVNAGACAGYTR